MIIESGPKRTPVRAVPPDAPATADLIPSAEIDPALVVAYVEWCCDCAGCRCDAAEAVNPGSRDAGR